MKNLDSIYFAARELPPADRPTYLTRVCEGDQALRRRVEQMLAVSDEAESFLTDLPDNAAEQCKPGPEPLKTLKLELADVPGEAVGQKIGRYKILERVGEGGCGVVYVAEQTEPVRRRVALKVIKLGMDTKQVVARFEAERQALAMMDHPNIAKVLDAGTTESGRPYFIMELVRGIKITDYCDQASLPTKERLGLFIQVCQAIQHAHQKGIIHRDIKPSNILVTLNDGVPVPKVIDFGIAKATEGRLTEATVYTQLHQFIGTPAYMSPEQAEMSSLDIDTRSDIYSLGVLLYELLAGSTPFDTQELMSLGIDAMRKAIREKEPVRPSTRLATLQGNELTTAAKRRAVEAPRLIHLLKGDLDWIVMKCLEKDRSRRYETANGLAADLKRHLNNEPVVARPPSQLYRFQKAARRNRVAFAAAAAVLVALAIGVVVSMAEAVQARHAREKALAEKARADREAATATHVSSFLEQMLNSANPEDLKGSDYTVRQLLEDCSAGLSDQLASEPEVEAAIRSTIGRAFYRLGAGEKAQKQLERVLALRRKLWGDSDERVAESQVDCAWAFFEQENFPASEAYAREGLRIYRERNALGQPFINGLWVLQKTMSGQRRFADVDAVTAEALAVAAKTPGVEYPEIASILHGQAEAKVAQEKYAEAESLARQALAMHQRLRKPGDLETAWALVVLGNAQAGEHKLPEAVTSFEQSLAIFRKQYSPAHKSVGYVLGPLRSAIQEDGDYPGLEKLDLDILGWQRSVPNSSAGSIAETLSSLASACFAQGKLADAEKWQTEAVNIMLGGSDRDISKLPAALRQAAQFYSRQGNPARAEGLFDTAIANARKKLGETNGVLAQFFEAYGYHLWTGEGKYEAATAQFQNALSIQRATPNDALAETLRNLGVTLMGAGKNPKEVENYEQESLDLYRSLHHADDPWGTAYPTAFLGRALADEGKFAKAEKLCREAMAIAKRTQGIGKGAYNISLNLLVETLTDEKKINEAIGLLEDSLARELKTRGNPDSEVMSMEKNMVALLASPAAKGDLSKQKREALDFVSRLSAVNLANLRDGTLSGLQEAGLRVEVRALCRQLVNKYSTNSAILNEIAWELATGLSPAPEDASLAVEAAEKATALAAGHEAGVFDTLADCYAVAGRFTNAVVTEREAIGMLTNNSDWQEQFAERVKLYEAGLTYCDVEHLTKYVDDLLEVKRFADAEPLAQRNLAMRQILTPNDEQLFSAQTMVGQALWGEGKFREAEPLLVAGYQGLEQRRDSIHFVVKKHIRNALESLAKICEATNRREQADQWLEELAKETR